MANRTFAEDYRAIREILVATRLRQGLTQVDLANRLSKPQSYVSKLERGERRIDLIELFQLAAALGISPQDLAYACFNAWAAHQHR